MSALRTKRNALLISVMYIITSLKWLYRIKSCHVEFNDKDEEMVINEKWNNILVVMITTIGYQVKRILINSSNALEVLH